MDLEQETSKAYSKQLKLNKLSEETFEKHLFHIYLIYFVIIHIKIILWISSIPLIHIKIKIRN